MANILSPILTFLWKKGSAKAREYIEKGWIKTADDLEKYLPEDLLVIKNMRDQEVLNAAKNKVTIPKKETVDKIDIFEDDIVQVADPLGKPKPTVSFKNDPLGERNLKKDSEIPSLEDLDFISNKWAKEAEASNLAEWNKIPENVRIDIEKNHALGKNADEVFNINNEKHTAPLPQHMPVSMLKAIDEGLIPMPDRYGDNFFNSNYHTNIKVAISQKVRNVDNSFSGVDEYGIKETGLWAEPKERDLYSKLRKEKKNEVQDYINFYLRKKDALKKKDLSDSNYAQKTMEDRSEYDRLSNQLRTEYLAGKIDPEFNINNLEESFNLYPYKAEVIENIQPNVDFSYAVEPLVIKPSSAIQITKKALKQWNETLFESLQLEAKFRKYKAIIPNLQRGHVLMKKGRQEIFEKSGTDSKLLLQVKYPLFYTNSTRNAAHKVLERNLIQVTKDIDVLNSSPVLKVKNKEEIRRLNKILSNIKHDMRELGVETHILNKSGTGYNKYGKGFTDPEELLASMNSNQTLKFLNSADDKRFYKSSYASSGVGPAKEGEGFNILPFEKQDGGFASIEEVLQYNNG
tara:strand:+ start:251 stop:1969 length:1719 start_codon:yes stop_codon:yes gene_type:complete